MPRGAWRRFDRLGMPIWVDMSKVVAIGEMPATADNPVALVELFTPCGDLTVMGTADEVLDILLEAEAERDGDLEEERWEEPQRRECWEQDQKYRRGQFHEALRKKREAASG